MLKFDRMKIITNISNIKNLNTDVFVASTKNDQILYYKYLQEKPYSLLIMVNYTHNELVLEFTGKILLDKYIHLLNKETIKDALSQINRLNICTIDVDAILKDGNVVKCDVTKDIELCYPIDYIARYVKANLTNYDKWEITPYKKEGVTIKNKLKTKRYKKHLSIYDKLSELQEAGNKQFLNCLKDKEQLLSYFKGKVRFELNIDTMIQIREYLNISDNSLQAVLNATTNPILDMINETIKDESPRQRGISLRDYERNLLLKECKYDLKEVEAIIRLYSSKTTSIKRVMQPYYELHQKLTASTSNQINLKELVV